MMDRYKEIRVKGKLVGRVCSFRVGAKMQHTPLSPDYRPLAESQPSLEKATAIVKQYREEDDETTVPV